MSKLITTDILEDLNWARKRCRFFLNNILQLMCTCVIVVTCICPCRYLVKSYRQAKNGQQLSGIVSYLNEAEHRRLQPQPVAARPTVVDINDLASLGEVYKLRAAM